MPRAHALTMRQSVVVLVARGLSFLGFLVGSVSLVSCTSKAPSPLAEIAAKCAHDHEGSCAVPILNVGSLKRSQAYYRDSLGFKVNWEHGDPPDFGSVSRGQGVIFMCQSCQGNPGTWIMMFTADIDGLHRTFRKNGALIRMPPTNMPWGMREMHVSDPDGNVIRFGMGLDHD
jgi:predicted enzyme related to lactoylglutathione lyase